MLIHPARRNYTGLAWSTLHLASSPMLVEIYSVAIDKGSSLPIKDERLLFVRFWQRASSRNRRSPSFGSVNSLCELICRDIDHTYPALGFLTLALFAETLRTFHHSCELFVAVTSCKEISKAEYHATFMHYSRTLEKRN